MRTLFALLVLLVPACGDTGTARNGVPDLGRSDAALPPPLKPPPVITVEEGGTSCAEVHEGCPCEGSGKTASCKIGPIHYGNLVECLVGDATCTGDGVWSRCIPNGSPPIIVTDDGGTSTDDAGPTQ